MESVAAPAASTEKWSEDAETMKPQQTRSPELHGRARELYDDPQGRAPRDHRLFPALKAQFGPADALDMMRWTLVTGPVVDHLFAEDLRAHIAWLYNALRVAGDGDPAEAPTSGSQIPPHHRDLLRASVCEAIAHIEGWAARHGIAALGTPLEDDDARCGWPDKAGHGWTPPWHILGIDRPNYWGTASDA